jgi:hypothetical protein
MKLPLIRRGAIDLEEWDGRAGRPTTAKAPKVSEQPARPAEEACGRVDSAGS